MAHQMGVDIVRVHDVPEHRDLFKAMKEIKAPKLTYIYPSCNPVPPEPRWWVSGHEVPAELTLQRPELKTSGTTNYLMGFRGKQGKRRKGRRPGNGPHGVLSEQHLAEWPKLAPQVEKRKRRLKKWHQHQKLRALQLTEG